MASRKGPTVGSGGQGRRKLTGRGPTPKAEDRTGHPAARRAASAARRAASSKPPRPSRGGGALVEVGADELVTGRNAVAEALRARVPATALLVALGLDQDDRLTEALALARKRGLDIIELPRPELDRLTRKSPHQGIALRIPPYAYQHPDDLLARAREASGPALLVALDGVTDPGNLGSVIRSTAAFGGHGVLVPQRRAAGVTAAAWKASAGAAARIPVAQAVNLTRALIAYRKQGLLVLGLAADGAVSLDELPAAEDDLVLVIGGEGRGLSRLVGETCDLRVSIPMAGPVESLNAGVAAGVALAEIARRRRFRLAESST